MEVKKMMSFESAHRLWAYQGKCANIHGHSYKVTVTLEGRLMTNGMVLDFGILSSIMKGIIDQGRCAEHTFQPWDHAMMLQDSDPLGDVLKNMPGGATNLLIFPFRPTAENMAQEFARLVALALEFEGRQNVRVKRVSIQETETSVATWDVEDDTM